MSTMKGTTTLRIREETGDKFRRIARKNKQTVMSLMETIANALTAVQPAPAPAPEKLTPIPHEVVPDAESILVSGDPQDPKVIVAKVIGISDVPRD